MLTRLRLQLFRNYDDALFSFEKGVNGIFGPNGSGKTNIIEAITLLSTGRSFRVAPFDEMVQFQKNGFHVEARLKKDEMETKIALGLHGTQKKACINATEYPFFSAVLGAFPTVVYAPRDMAILTGTPGDRRRFLNILLSQSSPLYLHHLTRYSRALKQRNAMLKTKQVDNIDIWDQQLAAAALPLMAMRSDTLTALSPHIKQFYNTLSPVQQSLSVTYTPSVRATSLTSYLETLRKTRVKDTITQTTNVGPHRDDFSLLLDSKKVRSFASEGQKRSCLAALKCSEWTLLHKHLREAPLFCVDDCPAHLDDERASRFIDTLSSFPQVILTAPSSDRLPSHNISNTICTALEVGELS